jgi:hypothetical protein
MLSNQAVHPQPLYCCTLHVLQERVAARLAEHQLSRQAASEEAAQREALTSQTRSQLDRKLGTAIKLVSCLV